MRGLSAWEGGGPLTAVRAVVGQRDSSVLAEGFEDIDAARMAWLNEAIAKEPRTTIPAELIERTKPGCCIACDLPLPPPVRSSGVQRRIHDVPECRRVYEAAYRALRGPQSKQPRTHCKHGHVLAEKYQDKHRRCPTCRKNNSHRYNATQRAKHQARREKFK